MTKKQFVDSIKNFIKIKPKEWRDGQAVFNYIDQNYHLARTVQIHHGIDCFYNDDAIDAFIDATWEEYSKDLIHEFPGENMIEE
jgi:hypothetical protein